MATMLKDLVLESIYLPKGIIKDYNVTINGKNLYDQAIDLNKKRSEEIRKLTGGQGEDYTPGCLLDYGYIKNHYRLIAVDLSRQKELDADPKAIQQITLLGQLKKTNCRRKRYRCIRCWSIYVFLNNSKKQLKKRD